MPACRASLKWTRLHLGFNLGIHEADPKVPFWRPRAIRMRALVLAGLISGFQTFATPPYLDLDADTSVDFRLSTQGVPSPFGFGVIASLEADRTRHPTNAVSSVLAAGTVVGSDTHWSNGASTVGLVGLRFQGRRGIHYGWMELTNPVINGRPSFAAGGWASRVFFNPNPGQPLNVGDTSIQLRAEFDSGAERLRLMLNCEASSFANGLAIQSRPALGPGTWTLLTRVFNGSSTTVPIDSNARLFRVVE